MRTLSLTGKNIPEEKLLAGLLNSDHESFSVIYDLYSGKLFGLIMKWVKDKEAAEILLLNTFVKAWNERMLFEEAEVTFYHWLCRHARFCYHEYVGFGVIQKV